MEKKEKTSKAGTASRRIFSAGGGGKRRAGEKITAFVLTCILAIMQILPVIAETSETLTAETAFATNTGKEYLTGDFDVTYSFHNVSNGTLAYHNFLVELRDETEGSTTINNCWDLRADNYGWTWTSASGITGFWSTNSKVPDGFWDDQNTNWTSIFVPYMKQGQDCTVNIVRSGNDFTIVATMGEQFEFTYSINFELGSSVSVLLSGEQCTLTNIKFVNNTKTDKPTIVTPKHVTVHDPSIIKEGDTYYVFGSHLAWAKSKDLIHWETFENNINKDYNTLFAAEAEWCKKADANYKLWPEGSATNMWAPDVIWNSTMKKWCMYMTINGPRWNSTICLLTADSLDGDWTYVGPVIQSGMSVGYGVTFDYTKVTGETTVNTRYTSAVRNNTPTYEPHAIDACVTYDDSNNLWMSYGSWSGGIGMIRLDNTTGLRDYNTTYEHKSGVTDPYTGYRLAGGNQKSGEASYIEKIGEYYYLYVTYGGFAATGGYNMRVFRSKEITGPYLDYSGDDARYPLYSGDPGTTSAGDTNGSVGNRLMSGYKWSYMSTGYVAQGHNSSFVDDDDKAYVIYHTRFNDGTEGHQVRVHQLFVNEDGWLVTAPFEYTGETLSSNVAKEEVSGAYEVLFHKRDINYANLEVVTGENLTFNVNGTITGDRTGTWEFSSKGAPYVTMKIGNVTYKGVFLKQQMEDSADVTWTFTVLGSDEISVWGYKYVGDGEELAKKAAENLVMPEGTFIDLELPAKGINNSTITWLSSNKDVLTDDGKITIPNTDTKVVLTGTFTVQGVSVTKDYPVTVYSPQTDKENKVLATYFTGEKKDLTNAVEGTYRYANPFYDGTTKGLEMYNGVSVKFDVEATGDTDTDWTHDILGFNSGSKGGLFFQATAYLGYNATGGNFDANLKNGKFIGQEWKSGTDFLKKSASVEMKLLPAGFEIYVDGKLVYNQNSVESYESGKTDYTVPGNVADITSYASVLDYLQNTANYLNFGWGSFWDNGYKGTISNVEFSVLPVEVSDTTGYLYYENYNKLAGKTGAATGWISGRAQSSLSVKLSDDENRYYLNYAATADAFNPSAYALFADEVKVSGKYTIELDTALTAGVLTQRSESGFAILGANNSDYTGTAINSEYILKLTNQPPQGTAANQTDRTLQDQWHINGSEDTITIPVGTWVHIKVDVNTEEGTSAVTITNRETKKVLYEGDVAINGTGTLGGLWLLRGRGVGTASIDNIKVHIHDWDEGEVTKDPTCTTVGEKTYTCSVCGETKTEEVEKNEHTPAKAVEENKVAPTCEKAGSYDEVVYCSVCNTEISREQKTIPATGHTYTASYASNKITISCSKCDSSKIITLDVAGGSIGNFNVSFDKDSMTTTLPESSIMSKEGYAFESWKDSAGKEYQAEFDVSNITSDITLSAVWKDTEAPTGSITVADNKWQAFLEKITFGIYKVTQEVITIEAEDNEEMGTIYYLIATGGITYTIDEIEALSADKWTEYQNSKKPVLEKDTKNVIYVKLVDKAGNTAYISSNGIVEDETAPEITMETIAGSVLDTSARIQITSNEAGTYYFLLNRGAEDSTLNADKLIETVGEGTAIEADEKITLDQTALQSGTLYTAYLVVVDLAGNRSECKTLSFKTVNEIVDITNAAISGDMIYHSQLTASAQNSKDLAMSYQWYRSSEAITTDTDVSSLDKISCESENYTLQKEDVGNYIAVIISITDESYGGFALAYTDSAVLPKEITASVEVADKVYDGTNNAEISKITLDGIVDGDDVTADAQAVFADANAAQGKEVTVSNITLSGEAAAAYQLTETEIKTTANINKRTLKIAEFTAADKVYDKTVEAEVATLEFEGVVEGEEISYEAVVQFADANAGENKTVSGTVKLTGSSVTNYILEGSDSEGIAGITGTAEIKKAQPEYTIPQNITAVYGSTLKDIELPEGFAFDISGLANGLDTEVGAVGTQELPAVYTPEDTTNYESVNVLIPVTVTKAAQEAPKLTAANETIYGKADGKLNGLTTAMEYSTDGTKYTPVEDNTMTFAAGTYFVRYKEDSSHFASPAVKLEIKEGRMLKVVFQISEEETIVRETGWNGEITDIPEIPKKTGYDQTAPKWDVEDFKNIKKDMTVHAVYTINTYTVNLTQGEGYTLQIADSEETTGRVDYLGSCSFVLTITDGYSQTDSFAVKANGTALTAGEKGTYVLADISENYTVTVEGIADLTAPTGEIKVKENIWNTSFAPTAWNLFFNTLQTVTITAVDKGSGVAEISYYLADTPLTVDNVNWTVYKEPFALMPNNEYIVYARIVDKAGNYTYINSEGMILDDIVPVVMVQSNGGFTAVSDGAEYERAQTFKVTDAYLDKVFVNNEQLSLSEEGTFVLEPSNDKYVIAAEDKAGNQVSYTISVSKAKGAGNVVMEGWTYGEAANEPQITDINNAGYTVKYYKGSEELDAAPVNAGDYTVKVTFNETEIYAEYVVFVDYTIAKAEVAAPASIEKTDETISGKNDGTITGLTAEMEYSKDGVNYTDVSGNADAQGVITLTGLEPGTYYIRYKTDENHNALVTTVTIQAGIVEEPATPEEPEKPTTPSIGIPQIKGENGKTGWQVIADEIREVLKQEKPQQKVDVQMNGSTELPRDIILEIKGKDLSLELDMGAGILWTIDGKTVTGNDFRNISMEVILDTDNIPRNILTGVTSGKTFKNLTLVHEGEFGFKPVLTINVGKENTSLLAKLYYYNKGTGQMELSDSGRVDANGNAKFTFTHASEYTIVIDAEDKGTTTAPDNGNLPVTGDAQSDIWNKTWLMLIASMLVVAGIGSASMKKRRK